MLFNSWEFICLFVCTTIFYFNISHKYRSLVLLLSSYSFYIYWRWDFALVMLVISLVNYFCGMKIHRAITNKERQNYLRLALVLSLAPLLYLKYANFFISNFNDFSRGLGIDISFSYLEVILPVGISFFTFQALSYSLDVYYRKTDVEENVINFSVFVAFFPQLIAGPIERSSNLLKQFRETHSFNRLSFIEGSKLFIWGLFKKVVIADRLAIYVDRIYEDPEIYSGSTLAVATFFFAIQIYCDFSGYSDMAIGSAKILGFNLGQNFKLPYFADSIADFWKRWHISLSSWFSDYLYKPLGGNRVSYRRWLFNIMVVFTLSGFWHGANWTFIIWGLLHGLYYFLENLGDTFLTFINQGKIKSATWYKVLKVVLVFLLVCYAWVFFRASNISEAMLISNRIILNMRGPFYIGSSAVTFVLSTVLIIFLLMVQIFQNIGVASLNFSPSRVYPVFQLFWYVSLLLGISMLGIGSNSFIYFQF